MSLMTDFVSAVSQYPKASVMLSIVEHTPIPPATAGAVNVNEVWSFQVRIANRGSLNMTRVALGIDGQNGTQVGTTAAGPWSNSISSFGNLTVNASSTQDSAKLYFKAPSAPRPAGSPLVRVHIQTFDANLDYILKNATGHADPPAGTYADQVYP